MRHELKKRILGKCISEASCEAAIDEILDLFNNSKRFKLSYLNAKKEEEELKIWAKDKEDALNKLEKIDIKATYIFIYKI